MGGVFDVLGEDHAKVKRMLAELEAGPSVLAGASSADVNKRKDLVQRLVIEESKHEATEEMHFWPVVRKTLPDGDKLADTAVDQEQVAKKVLARLDRRQPGHPEFEDLIAAVIAAARAHISYEESEVWPRLREALTPDQDNELGRKIERAKKIAPTRPHPHTPPIPGALKTAGPAAALADRLGDAATDRGRS